jgi:hypothetical protein
MSLPEARRISDSADGDELRVTAPLNALHLALALALLADFLLAALGAGAPAGVALDGQRQGQLLPDALGGLLQGDVQVIA